jgi:O-antigen ligase
MDNSIRLQDKKYRMHTIVMTMILFSGSALYSEDSKQYYMYIILAICGCSFIYILLEPNKIKLLISSKFSWWIFVVFGWYFTYGMLLTTYAEFNSKYIFFILIVILNIIIWFSNINYQKSIDVLIKSSAISSILLCAFIIYNEGSLILSGSTRIGDSASGNVNTVGLYLGVFSILCLYKFLYEKNYKYIYIYSMQVVFMLLTGSKKTLLFIVLGFILMYILKEKFKIYKYVIPIIVLVGLIYVILNNQLFYNIIGKRTIDFLGQIGILKKNVEYSRSTELREYMISRGWQAFCEKPIFGNGWFYFSRYSGLETYSHNNYIEMLVTYGIFGFMLYYGMYLNILVSLYKQLRNNNYAKLFFTLILILLISDYASVTFYESPRNYIVLLFAYMIHMHYDKKSGINKLERMIK